MFTGLIEEIGAVQSIHPVADGLRLQIQCREILSDVTIDASICVNGVCLTVVQFDSSSFQADAVAETVARTNLKKLTPGSRVNLERALRLSDRLGGHLVQGHVDGTGQIIRFERRPNNTLLTIKAPQELFPLLIPKGSIAIDGVSLTIAALSESVVTIAVIPHTLEKTIIKHYSVGDEVNLEADLIGKYLARFVNTLPDGNQLTLDKLMKYGFA